MEIPEEEEGGEETVDLSKVYTWFEDGGAVARLLARFTVLMPTSPAMAFTSPV